MMNRKEKQMPKLPRTYGVDVTDEEMGCIIVVAKLLIKLLIAYFTEKQVVDTVNSLKDTLLLLTRKNN